MEEEFTPEQEKRIEYAFNSINMIYDEPHEKVIDSNCSDDDKIKRNETLNKRLNKRIEILKGVKNDDTK